MQDNTMITNQYIMIKSQQNNKSSIKGLIINLLLLLSISTSLAQTYPVQVTPQVVPPYSVKLSDYATITSEKLYVNLLLTDLNEVGRRVKLRLYVEGNGLNVRSNDIVVNEPVIILDGGISNRLSNLDLKPYFELNNLSGISPNQYRNPLPDGGYSYCFEVLDYFTGRQLSQKSCTTIYLQQNNPPVLNVPFKDDVVTVTNPQNILFTWTPRHTNAPNVEYEFTIKELWDTRMNPQTTFLSSPVFYQATTYTPTLLFGPAEPQLLPGKVYAWQVRAFVTEGGNEIASFRNDGRSEIFWFKYIEDCHPPTYVLSEALTAKSVKVQWQTSDHLKYRIQYRKKGFDSEDDWFEVNSYTTEGTIHNLESATTYEFRVGGQCTELSGYVYSPIQEFTTPNLNDEAGYNCGVMPSFQLDGTEPLPQLHRNDVFTAGDFPVTVKDVQGQNGTFSGWGYIIVPYLGDTKIKVGFESIKINKAYQLIDGVVQTDYSAEWENIGSIDETIETITGNNGEIKQYDATNIDLANVVVKDNGNVVLIGEDGQEYPIDVDTPLTVTDQNGEQWTANEDGTVTQGQVAEGGVPNQNNTNGVNSSGDATAITSEDVEVIFMPSGYYATDKKVSNLSASKYKEEYETLESTDGNYDVLYKLVSNTPNQEDQITAEVSLKNGVTTDDIVFKTKRGSKVPVTWSDNTATLTLKNQFKFAKATLLATVKPKDSTGKYEVAGKLNLWHAQQRTVNVTLIGVNGESVSGLKDKLNQIYNPVGIHFKVTEKNFNIAQEDWDVEKTNEVLDVGDSDLLANYTPEERAIFKKYKEENGISGQEYYLFVIGDKIPTSKSIEGFMPLARQYGFVFNAGNMAKTIAHELGHGVFGLKHPFKEYGTDEYENTYLMSYGSGTKFTHMDWQKLHAPGLQFYIFQGDSDGESTVVSSIPKEFVNSDNKTLTFMTLNGSYITLPTRVTDLTFSTGLDNFDKFIDYPIGALIKFKLDGVTFKAKTTRNYKFVGITKEDLTFTYKGFKSLKDGHFYGANEDEKEYNKFDNGNVIALIPHYTTKYNDPYNLRVTIESGYQFIKIPRQDLSFSPNAGEQVTVNLLDDYTNISKFFSGYRSNPKPSKSYPYKGSPFNSQFELRAEYVNPILKDFSWTNKHAILAKYAVLNNAQPELFKSFFKRKYGLKSYTDIFKELDIDRLKETYIDLINSFSKEKENLIEELHNLLATTKVDKPSLVATESVRINEILEQLTTEQIKKYINLTQRETAIELLLVANGTHTDYGEDNGGIKSITNKFDKQILKLIKFAVKDDKQEILSSLTQNDYKLFWKSIEKLNGDSISDFLNLYTQYVNDKKDDRIKHRIDVLTKLSDSKEDDWGNKTEKVFASIISNLDDRSQDQADLVTFFESKPEVLKNAFLALDNFVKVEELADFIFTICSWKVKLGDSSGINQDAFKEYNKVNYLIGSSKSEVQHIKPIDKSHNYIPYFRESWIKSAQEGDNFYLDTKFNASDNKINLELYRYGHEIINDSYSPLEYVYVHFREDSSYESYKFKKGTGLTVPAIFIHWLDDSVDDNQNMAVARVVANILAIVAAPSTFGASLAPFVVNVEVAANLIDIYVTVNRQELMDNGLQKELAYWDAAFAIYSLKDLPDAIIGIGNAGKGFINTTKNITGAIQQNRTILKSDNLNNAVDAFHAIQNTAKKEEVIKSLDKMLYVLKYENPQKLDPVSKLINYRTYFKFRTKLATEFKKGAPTIIDITPSGVDFKPSLVYSSRSSKVNLGTIEFNSNNVLTLSNSKRFLPSGITNTEELATIKNVLVETAAGSKGINHVSIVKNLDNEEVFIKLLDTNGVEDNLTSLIESIKKNVQLSAEDIASLKNLSIDDLKLIHKASKLKYRRGTVTFNLFEKTMYNSTIVERAKAYELWGEMKWDDLYDFFHKDPNNLINGGWPPFDGFVKIEGTLKGNEIIKGTNTFTNGKRFNGIFDRFQNPGQENLGGGFACPVFKGEYDIDVPYTHDSRALLDDIELGTVYLKFNIKDATGLEFKYGDIIPWKNKKGIIQQGMGKQIQIKGGKFHDKSFDDKHNLIQKSIYEGGGKWRDVIEDKSIKVDKILGKIKKCD